MFSRKSLAMCLMLALPLTAVASAQRGHKGPPSDKPAKILEFGTMVGVVAPFTGSANPIRGINGGGVPWKLTSAKGELGVDGKLELEVEGLVLVSTGVNPVASFNAVVSCQTIAGGLAGTMNVAAGPVPATSAGDAEFEAVLALPSPCIAPIVFVTNAAGTSWFAATGF